MNSMTSRSKNMTPDENYVVPDKLKIETNDMVTCRNLLQHQNRSFPQVPTQNIIPDDFKKMREELVKTKMKILESTNHFDKIVPQVEKLLMNTTLTEPTLNYSKINIKNEPHINTKVPPPKIGSTNSSSLISSSTLATTSNSSTTTKLKTSNSSSSSNSTSGTTTTTQKTSSGTPRADRPNPPPKVNNRSERSYRATDRNVPAPTTTGNPLDIWIRSASLFHPLPTVDEIEDICRAIETDKHLSNGGRPGQRKHWSDRLKEIVKNTQKDTRKSKNQLAMPPGKPPAPDDVSDYWAKRPPPFQIETIQRNNKSVMHCLLSAFVEAKPLPRSEEGGENRDFLPTHVLLPQLEIDEYLSHPFEERLEFELQSAGLEKPAEGTECYNDVFSQEIEQFREEINGLQPQIEEIKNDIIRKLPEFRQDEERRMTEAQEYGELLKEFRRKNQHKK